MHVFSRRRSDVRLCDGVDDCIRATRRDLARLPWVTYQRAYGAAAVRQLSMLGTEPRVEVSVDSFQLLHSMIAAPGASP
jgi:hypothetical protein